MRLHVATILLACSLGAGWAQTRPAQPAKPFEDNPQARIILDVTRVNLLFTVTDKRGRFVTDLTKDDFSVREGKNVQKILDFTAETDLPLRLAILVDSSNSIRDRFRFIQEAAIEFLTSVMRPQQDKAAVISFDTAAELQADLSNDVESSGARDPPAQSGRRDLALRRDLLRQPGQADAGPAPRQDSAGRW